MSHPTLRVTLRPLPGPLGFPLSAPRPVDRRVTLAQWLRLWLEEEVRPDRAPTTVYGYENIVENHLVPALGGVRLRALQPAMVHQYYRWLAAEKGLSRNTIRKHHVLLHTSLQAAFRRGVLPANPMQRVTPPSPTPATPRFYTPAQLSCLLDAVAGHSLELPVKLACCLGLRRGELLGLRWQDVDLQTGTIAVRRARTTIGSRVVEKQPKTTGSFRTLSIGALDDLSQLLARLYAQRRRSGAPCGPDDLLVLNALGVPFHPNGLTRAFNAFVAAQGLPPITLHGLRHTFASMAGQARVPLYQISQAMGHSSPSTTQRIYTHLFDPTHGEVLAAVAAAIQK